MRPTTALTPEVVRHLSQVRTRVVETVAAPTWDEMFIRLQAYKETHGNCDVPDSWSEDPALGSVGLCQKVALLTTEFLPACPIIHDLDQAARSRL